MLIAFVVVWITFIDTYSLMTRYQLTRQKAQLEARTEQLTEETRILEQKIEDLETNPDLLERIAREEYGMRKPGETVYIITEE